MSTLMRTFRYFWRRSAADPWKPCVVEDPSRVEVPFDWLVPLVFAFAFTVEPDVDAPEAKSGSSSQSSGREFCGVDVLNDAALLFVVVPLLLAVCPEFASAERSLRIVCRLNVARGSNWIRVDSYI